MKWGILIAVLLFSGFLYGQNTNIEEVTGDYIKGDKTVESSLIKIIFPSKVAIYNLKDSIGWSKLKTDLQTLPEITFEMKMVLQYDKQIIAILNSIKDEGIVNSSRFLSALDSHIRENERLRIENEKLRKNTSNQEFAGVLEKANKKLEQFDNEDYQQILEDYKVKQLIKGQNEYSVASYLQAKNSYNNYNFEKALKQIKEALKFNDYEIEYLLLESLILYNLFQISECINTLEKILLLTNNDNIKFDCYINLSSANAKIGNEDKALFYAKEALQIKELTNGIEDTSADICYVTTAAIYNEKENYNEALRYCEKTLQLEKRRVIPNLPIVADCFNTMGFAYNLKKDYDSALYFYNKSLDIRIKIYDTIDPKVAFSYHSLGSVYDKKGEFTKAFYYDEKALKIKEKVFGIDHPSTALTYNNIGTIFSKMDDYDKALGYYSKALKIREKMLSNKNKITIETYRSIGFTYEKKENYDSAIEYYNKALNSLEEISDANNFSKQSLLFDIGLIFLLKHDEEKAQVFFKKSNLSAQIITNNIDAKALFFRKKNSLKEVINLSSFGLSFLKKNKVPKSNYLWIETYYNLAEAYCGIGQKAKATPLLSKALSLSKETADGRLFTALIEEQVKRCN